MHVQGAKALQGDAAHHSSSAVQLVPSTSVGAQLGMTGMNSPVQGPCLAAMGPAALAPESAGLLAPLLSAATRLLCSAATDASSCCSATSCGSGGGADACTQRTLHQAVRRSRTGRFKAALTELVACRRTRAACRAPLWTAGAPVRLHVQLPGRSRPATSRQTALPAGGPRPRRPASSASKRPAVSALPIGTGCPTGAPGQCGPGPPGDNC